MHRFYIPPENWNPEDLVLTGSEAHHALRVLRLKRGDKVVVFNGEGREITAEITQAADDEIRLRKLHERETPPPRYRITLGQAIPKGKNMELIVQKAVELGTAEIAPLISQRTIVDFHPAAAARKRTKWQQIAIEAAKQSGQNWLPRVRTPQKLAEFLDLAAVYPSRRSEAQADNRRNDASGLQAGVQSLRLIGSLQSDAQRLKKVLADYASEHSAPAQKVLMLIGPEGDFTPEEITLAKDHGCIPITFGPIVLRVETAAIYCLSILSYELTAQ
jgi:16S rRNA (uracil1498-N3)-methyltransferase